MISTKFDSNCPIFSSLSSTLDKEVMIIITTIPATTKTLTTNDRHDTKEEEKRDECSVKPTDRLFGTRAISSYGAFALWTRTRESPLSPILNSFLGYKTICSRNPRKIASVFWIDTRRKHRWALWKSSAKKWQ